MADWRASHFDWYPPGPTTRGAAASSRSRELVYRDRVWAIVGGVDGPTTHLAEQVVVKARLALVSPVSTDKTVNLTNVPWMFSLAPNDRLVAEVLTEEIARQSSAHNLILITTNDHDAFLLTRELRRAMTTASDRRDVISSSINLSREPATPWCKSASRPNRLTCSSSPTPPIQLDLVRALRQAGFVGCLSSADPRAAASRSSGKWPTWPANSSSRSMNEPRPTRGDRRTPLIECQPRLVPAWTQHEDYAALQMYDAVQLVTSAIGKAGLNRVAIAHAIRDLSPLAGLSGRIEWDAPGSNTRRPTLATIVQGRVVPLRDALVSPVAAGEVTCATASPAATC